MKLGYYAVLLVNLVVSISGKMDIIIDEKIETCVGSEKAAGVMDISQMELVAVTDTKLVLNGTVTFLKTVQPPWLTYAFAEKYDRGKWNLYAYEKKIPDFCSVIHNPTELWYYYTKNLKGCPLQPGDQWNYKELEANTDLPVVFPSHFAGKWRNTLTTFYTINGVEMKECFRVNYEMIERRFLG